MVKLQKFSDWCNAHKGIIELTILLVAIIALIPFNRMDITFAKSLPVSIKNGMIYEINIPIYIFLILAIAVLLYMYRLRERYTIKYISTTFFIGTWKNEWNGNGKKGSEIFQITKDGRYLINGVHMFNIVDFSYDEQKGKLKFIKSGVAQNDNRKLLNILEIKNNELLLGTEESWKVKYTKLSN